MGNDLPSNSGNNNHRHYRYLHYITYQEEKGEARNVTSRRCLEIYRCRLCFPPSPPPLKSVLMHEGVREGSRTIISLIALLNEFIYVDQGPGTRDQGPVANTDVPVKIHWKKKKKFNCLHPSRNNNKNFLHKEIAKKKDKYVMPPSPLKDWVHWKFTVWPSTSVSKGGKIFV